jgi:MFS family permease
MSDNDDSQVGNNHVHDTEGSEIESAFIRNAGRVLRSKFVGEYGVLGPPWARPIISTMMFFGTQSVWSTEMAYGTTQRGSGYNLLIFSYLASPFLYSLGLSKAVTALVFLAAPVSGFTQPLIGALADHSTSRFGRRRPIMLAGSLLCGLAMLTLSWSTDISNMVGGVSGLSCIVHHSFFLGQHPRNRNSGHLVLWHRF